MGRHVPGGPSWDLSCGHQEQDEVNRRPKGQAERSTCHCSIDGRTAFQIEKGKDLPILGRAPRHNPKLAFPTAEQRKTLDSEPQNRLRRARRTIGFASEPSVRWFWLPLLVILLTALAPRQIRQSLLLLRLPANGGSSEVAITLTEPVRRTRTQLARQFEHPIFISLCVVNVSTDTSCQRLVMYTSKAAALFRSHLD